MHRHAVATLRVLADETGGTAGTIASAGGLPPLVALLKSPCLDVLVNALCTLIVVCLNTMTGAASAAAAAGAIPSLIVQLKSLPPAAGPRALSSRLLLILAGSATKQAAECIKGASIAITATRCAPLIELLKDDAPEYRAAGCRALRALASDRAARAALVGAGVQAALASLLSETDDAAVRECVATVLATYEPV